jgi:putative DNA primase/helicase
MENNHRTALKSFEKEQYENTQNNAKPIKLNPVFDDLNNPATILNHVEQLKGKSEAATPHAEILYQLIELFEPLDFELLAFPQAENFRKQMEKAAPGSEHAKDLQKQLDKLKLNLKHFLVLSIENSLLFAEKNRWGLCKNHDFIYLYNGTFWAEIDKETFQKFLGEAAEKMGVAKFSARFYQFREQLFKQFLATAYLPTPESNKDTVLINLQNGTFEISPQGTKLRPFDRSDFITYQLPFEYNPQAKAPLFEMYLNKVLPDPERQRVLAEYLGFVFIKHGSNALKEEKALILYGTGANGKSVFFEVVNALLGNDNVSSYSLQSLTNDNGYFRAKLANKLVNYASEINGNLEASIFKQLVSGEPVEARLPYGQPFILKQYAKLIFNCNELPKDVEHTNAYFRRFLIIPFDVTIPPQEQDKNLHTKIIEKELSGVFNWVLEGLNRLLEQKKFSDCEAAQQAVEQYKIESNSVQMFLNENEYKGSPTNYKLIKDVYPEYRNFCSDDGMTPFKKTNFIKQLRALSLVVDRVSQNQLAVFIEAPGLSF